MEQKHYPDTEQRSYILNILKLEKIFLRVPDEDKGNYFKSQNQLIYTRINAAGMEGTLSTKRQQDIW